MIEVTKKCPMCKDHTTMLLTNSQSAKYSLHLQRKDLIQNLLPELNPSEREFLISGYCHTCQEMLFGKSYTSLIWH